MNDPQQVDCHDCGATPGNPCQADGRERRPHPARIREAREQYA